MHPAGDGGSVESSSREALLTALGVQQDAHTALMLIRELKAKVETSEKEARQYQRKLAQCEARSQSYLLADLLAAALTRKPPQEALAEAVNALELLRLADKA